MPADLGVAAGRGGGGSPAALSVYRMEELGLYPADRQVYFGQLLGMCDQISFPLGELGLPGEQGWGCPGLGLTASACVQVRQAFLCTSMCPMAL